MKQSEQSKKWMIEALFMLMKTKPFNTITVKDITDKAGISRLTFYRNFESKEDILRYHMQLGFQEYIEQIRHAKEIDLKKTIALCYAYWGRRQDEIRLISSQNLGWLLKEPFEDFFHLVLKELNMDEKYSYFQAQFIIGGMFSDMLAWINEPQGRNAEDIAEEILEIVALK